MGKISRRESLALLVHESKLVALLPLFIQVATRVRKGYSIPTCVYGAVAVEAAGMLRGLPKTRPRVSHVLNFCSALDHPRHHHDPRALSAKFTA